MPAKWPNQDTSGGERPLDGLQNICFTFLRFLVSIWFAATIGHPSNQDSLVFHTLNAPILTIFWRVVDQ